MVREIKNFGLMDYDLLSTFLIDGKYAKLLVFNHGAFGRITKLFNDFKDEDFQSDLGDWLWDRMHDENINAEPFVLSVKFITFAEAKELTDITEKYNGDSFGDVVAQFEIKMNNL